jgi:hypothetical protein
MTRNGNRPNDPIRLSTLSRGRSAPCSVTTHRLLPSLAFLLQKGRPLLFRMGNNPAERSLTSLELTHVLCEHPTRVHKTVTLSHRLMAAQMMIPRMLPSQWPSSPFLQFYSWQVARYTRQRMSDKQLGFIRCPSRVHA